MGFQPTQMTYNMLMNAYARGGQHHKLPQLLKEMEGILLSQADGEKGGQVPDVKSYEKLRSILDVKVAKQNKRNKSAIMGIINSKIGMVKAKRKTKKAEFWKNKKKDPSTAAKQ
ncbi:hypothetical protein F3Y22_tig00111847pilonHSYRG00170 [Hibiscus syriacus]|uniref:Pentatricopeptide repeat-containing protein n=1 Tax=Hibiscus syriacus TaxID=106335 RepID=A0A6A2XA28_HIBSY|nr:hypothetical protein F3Y22_tig00111847pilonHSYRG00170 [Hibiscus syriacus]